MPDPRLTPIDAIATDHAEQTAYYRSCDFCYESAVDDIHADLPEWREFYRTTKSTVSLIVCENCVEQFKQEEATP